MLSSRDIELYFSDRHLNEYESKYLRQHSKRYAWLLNLVNTLRSSIAHASIRILDVGPSFLTELLRKHFATDTIAALGFTHERSRGGHLPAAVRLEGVELYHFDLNTAGSRDRWLTCTPFDIVIMAEVLEHLYCAPTHVLAFIKSLMKPRAWLIIQTPNAASTINRVSLLIGRNPYPPIRENADNPGHYHEYTKRELMSLAAACGFSVQSFTYQNYFNRLNTVERIYGRFQSIAPPSFRDAMTIVLSKGDSSMDTREARATQG
jgi:predicted SAM-dependent methyltransferase